MAIEAPFQAQITVSRPAVWRGSLPGIYPMAKPSTGLHPAAPVRTCAKRQASDNLIAGKARVSMQESTYAVVSYLTGPLAEFVNTLRQRLNPTYGDWLAHVSVLPPRRLAGPFHSQDERLQRLRSVCRQAEPFEVELDGVTTFWPVNGVVYLSVGQGQADLHALHTLLNENGMRAQEAYSYVPHVTIAQSLDERSTHAALAEVMQAWAELAKPVRFAVDSLVLVGQVNEPGSGERWVDIAPIPLGSLAMASSH